MADKSMDTLPTQPPAPKPGVRLDTVNLHSKQPSGIAVRLRKHGVDWVADLAAAIKSNDLTRINMWMKMMPYLVVTQGHRKIGRSKKRASRAAMAALEELEGR